MLEAQGEVRALVSRSRGSTSKRVGAAPFLSTRDGMGFIGPIEEGSNILLALCYGGNGMTHAIVAGRLIVDHVMGRKNADAEIFRVRRFH